MDAAHRSNAGGTLEELDETLAHFGIKGMRWGFKKAPSGPPSDDSKRAGELASRVKTGGTRNLSNKELQDLVTRINLEQQYSKLSEQGKKKNPVGKFAADLLLTIGKQQVTKIASDMAGKKVAAMMAKKVVAG